MAEEKPSEVSREELLRYSAEIVASYVGRNKVASDQLGEVINTVFNSLSALDGAEGEPIRGSSKPAIPVRRSVMPDYIVCLEDGKHLKMLKRHLASSYNLTPEQYRAKWGLEPGYPMVAPNYAEKRSALAKQIGLGTKRNAA